MKLWLDIETRSPIPIKRGIAAYSKQVEIIMVQWAVDDGPVTVSDNGYVIGTNLLNAVSDADEVWAHNADFEQQIFAAKGLRHHFPAHKWRCTMALARMHGLPGGLDKLSAVFKLPTDQAKDKRGHALIQLFCVPRKDGGWNDKTTHPKEWAEFREYGASDITSMRAVHKRCPKWNATPRMWSLWQLDQRMNREGVAVDTELCRGAIEATTKAKRKFNEDTDELTLGLVGATTQRDKLLAYLSDYGVALPDLTADTVTRRLEDENLPDHIKTLLRIRQQASKASTAKYSRVLAQQTEGRLRNLLVFCGASRTGRWAGRTFQPQNLPRPKHSRWMIEQAITMFRNDAIDLYAPEECMGLASSCLRGVIIAPEGRKLVVADLANIEGRMMAWMAGETWKIKAFRAYDNKTGPDLYKLAYAREFGINPDEIGDDDPRRQIGKVVELSLQYYGGVGAFCSMAEVYALDLDALAEAAWPVIPAPVKQEAADAWLRAKARKRTYGLTERVWQTCESLVRLWRIAHPKTVEFWYGIENAARKVLSNPSGVVVSRGRLSFDRVDNWFRIKLPSGRYLSYPASRCADELSFMGVDTYTKQWSRISTYSGKLAENIIQAASADVLMDGLRMADATGYCPVLTVHDEIIAEPPDDAAFTAVGLSELMTGSSLWADGLPLTAKGFEAKRYHK